MQMYYILAFRANLGSPSYGPRGTDRGLLLYLLKCELVLNYQQPFADKPSSLTHRPRLPLLPNSLSLSKNMQVRYIGDK